MTDSELLQKISQELSLLRQAVLGNGVKGVVQRLDAIEKWIGTHPAQCPFLKKRSEILGVRVMEVSVIAVIITALELLLRAIHVVS